MKMGESKLGESEMRRSRDADLEAQPENISNRQFLIRLETPATRRKQSSAIDSNRHFWEPLVRWRSIPYFDFRCAPFLLRTLLGVEIELSPLK